MRVRSDPAIAAAGMIAIVLAGFAPVARAQSPTPRAPVDTADTVITVATGEAISTSGMTAHAIRSTGDGATITVDGGVATTGEGAYGVQALGADVAITVGGTIRTDGDAARGIYAEVGDGDGDGVGADIRLTGELRTFGAQATGILAEGADAVIAVATDGLIETAGENAVGIRVSSSSGIQPDDSVITLDGTIRTTGLGSDGIFSSGANNGIVVNGVIETADTRARGVRATGADSEVSVVGTVRTRGSQANGVEVTGRGTTVRVTGDVETFGDRAVGLHAAGSGTELEVTGTVRSHGTGSRAIRSLDGGTVFVSGLVEALNDDAIGMFLAGDGTRAVVTGTVRTRGTESLGIRAFGGGTIAVGGTVEAVGDRAAGIQMDVADTHVVVTGTVRARGAGAHGIRAQDGGTIAVGGTVEAVGDRAAGIQMDVADTHVVVTGTVRARGAGAHGIRAQDGGTITVSGAIRADGQDSHAIFGEGGQTLRLLRGWQISGPITFEEGAGNALELETGYPAVSRTIRIANLDRVSAIGDGPVLFDGDEAVAVLDPSASAMQRTALAEVTRALHGAVHDRGAAARPAPDSVDTDSWLDRVRIWGAVVGSDLERGTDDLVLEWSGRAYGIVGGAEGMLDDGLRVGVLGGYVDGEAATGTDSIDVETGTGVLGVYGEIDDVFGSLGGFDRWTLTGTLIGGYNDLDTTRRVHDSVAGRQQARGSHDGLFASPSLGLRCSRSLADGYELRPAVRVDGLVARFGSYAEDGAGVSDIEYDTWTSISAAGRAQLGLAALFAPSAEFEVRAGATSRAHAGDQVTVQLRSGGASATYDVPGGGATVGGFVGGRLDWTLGDRFALVADGEYGRSAGDGQALTGFLRLSAAL